MTKDKIIARAKRVIEIEQQAINGLLVNLGQEFVDAIGLLADAVEAKNKVVVVGVGKSGNISHKIAATLNSTGATAVVLNSQNALHGDLGIISDGDVVLALSYSGETAELVDLIPSIKRFDVKLISITGKAESTLARYSDIALLTPVEREACPLNLAPTSSSTAALVMGDALAMVLLDARGFTEKDFARYHPGGSLGRALLTKVEDIMRTGDSLAKLAPGVTVEVAIGAMSKSRSGACVLVSEDGGLAGVFTHGDFARAFEQNDSVRGRLVSEFMTVEPITVLASSLAAEAIKKIGKHKVDDIVVLDDAGKPVGLVDTQDFARLKLI
ncbi:MAG: KpsF/GutQ family sugar-phosphate isomerase [Akkermansiaceae bacterium]